MIKRYHSLGYLVAYILPLSVIVGNFLGGWYNYTTIIVVFIVIPLIDQLNGTDNRILSNNESEGFENANVHRYILYSWVLTQILLLGWSFFVFSAISDIWAKIGFVISVGLVTGAIGITVAHELGHKKSKFEQILSKTLLMTVFYMHFFIEHNKGHHLNVGTRDDPATARKGENFYLFYVRTVFGSYRHAWTLEKVRINRKGLKWYSNQLIWFTILPIIYCFSMMCMIWLFTESWHWNLLVFFLLQSVIAFTLLELVNYVEHYGLSRKKIGDRYEPVSEFHSWNSSHAISNYFLFQLQLHSDHHMNTIKRYQSLQHCENSPQLPAGYPSMILMALIPPLWKHSVHPILNKWEAVESTTHIEEN